MILELLNESGEYRNPKIEFGTEVPNEHLETSRGALRLGIRTFWLQVDFDLCVDDFLVSQ